MDKMNQIHHIFTPCILLHFIGKEDEATILALSSGSSALSSLWVSPDFAHSLEESVSFWLRSQTGDGTLATHWPYDVTAGLTGRSPVKSRTFKPPGTQ